MGRVRVTIILVVCCCQGLVSCALAPHKAREMVVWPKAPELPRYMHESTLRTELDITKISRGEMFRRTMVGEDPKQKLAFVKPYDVAAREGRIIISDTMANSVTLFDIPRRQVMHFGRSVEGKLVSPLGLSIDGALNYYVADATARQVVVFNATGHFIKRVGGPGQLVHPTDVAVTLAGDRIFVVDAGGLSSNDHRVLIYDAEGALLSQFGTRGTRPGEFNLPTSIAIAPDNNVYVLDAGNFRVQVFDVEGQFVRAWGEVGRGLGNFARPRGIAIDPDGNVYVSDAAYRNVQIFDPQGNLLMWLGGDGMEDRPGQYVLPAGVAVDESRRVYIVDQLFVKVDVIRQLPEEEALRLVAARAQQAVQATARARGGARPQAGSTEVTADAPEIPTDQAIGAGPVPESGPQETAAVAPAVSGADQVTDRDQSAPPLVMPPVAPTVTAPEAAVSGAVAGDAASAATVSPPPPDHQDLDLSESAPVDQQPDRPRATEQQEQMLSAP